MSKIYSILPGFNEITSSEVNINNKLSKMSDIDLTLTSSVSSDGKCDFHHVKLKRENVSFIRILRTWI